MGFAKEAASFLLFKMFPFTYILLLSLFWMFFIHDIAIDLFWSEIIGFISVEQTSGLSKWIIINFFFFTFFLRRPTTTGFPNELHSGKFITHLVFKTTRSHSASVSCSQ